MTAPLAPTAAMRRVVPLASLGVGGVLLFLLFRVVTGGATAGLDGPPSTPPGPASTVVPGLVASRNADEARAPPPTGGLVRTAIEPIRSTSGPTLTVIVVDAATDLPVPGATVRGLWSLDVDFLTSDAEQQLARSGWDPEAVLAGLGSAAVTGLDGQVEVPRPDLSAGGSQDSMPGLRHALRTLVARKGDLYGEAELRDVIASELRIALEPDRTAHVVVVADGRPAPGVHVLHRVRTLTREIGTTGRNHLATTGPDGTLTVPHLQTRVLDEEQVSTLAVYELGIELPEVALDCENPPAEPIRFHLPPFGGLVVEVRDPGGATRGRPGTVTVSRPGTWSGFSREVQDGRARFDYVGLRRDFEIAFASGWLRESRVARGPGHPGEVTEVVLEIAARPILEAMVLLPDGTPLRAKTLAIHSTIDGGEVRALARTDEAGHLRHALGTEQLGASLQSVRLSTLFDADLLGMYASFSGPRTLDGRVDLGELQLEDMPLYATGRVVDDREEPVAGATLRIEPPAGGPEVEVPVVRMLDAGRFELRGETSTDALRILANGPRREGQRAPVDVTRGARDVEVVLTRTGSIDATFLHGPGQEYRLDCAMYPAGGGEPVHAFPFPEVSGEGTTYFWSALLPGTWRLAATLLGEPTPTVTIDGIEIRPGTNQDPRLAAVELSDVATLRIELVDASGALARNRREGQVYVRDRATGQWTGRIFRAARTFVLTRPGPTDVVVAVPGYRPIRRTGVEGVLVAELEPLPVVPVRIVVDGVVDDPPRFGVQAEPLAPGAERYRVSHQGSTAIDCPSPWLGPAWIRAGRTGEVTVEGPGRYRLKIRIARGLVPETELSGFTPTTFTVPEDGAPRMVEVHVRAAALRR